MKSIEKDNKDLILIERQMFLWININILFLFYYYWMWSFVCMHLFPYCIKRKKENDMKKKTDSHLSLSHKRKTLFSFRMVFFSIRHFSIDFFSSFRYWTAKIQQKRQITITKCATKEDKSLENWICCALIEARENNGQVLYIQNQFIVAAFVTFLSYSSPS